MHLKKMKNVAIAALLLTPMMILRAQASEKKLIEFGWDKATPIQVYNNVQGRMQKYPFDGIVMYLPGNARNVFDITKWDEEKPQLLDQLRILRLIKWGKLTDNFISMNVKSSMDWFSDSDWEKVLSKVMFLAQAGKAGRCKGLVLDPEAYGFSPWVYEKQKNANTISYDDYAAKVFQRGRQFMNAMQKDWPGFKLLVTSQYIGFYHPQQAEQTDAPKPNHNLYKTFLNGMLDAADPGVQMVDCNEAAYYYTDPIQYFKAYWTIRQGARNFAVPPELREKYDTHIRAGSALFIDQVFGTRKMDANFVRIHGKEKAYAAPRMTPDKRARWCEQNAYYALQTSDEYVWVYSQQMNWWWNRDIPPGALDAITSAKNKVAANKDLGFDMDAVFDRVQANQ